MPVYNTAKYLNEAIDSILNQTYKDFEFIIIDDCSTDGSLDIIKTYSDDRIILIENETNKGYVYGLNYALSFAKGKYIARMDSDDISLPNRFKRQFYLLENNTWVTICGTFMEKIHNSEQINYPISHNEIKVRFLENSCLSHPTVMFRKSFIIDNNLIYDEKMIPTEDYDLWTKMSCNNAYFFNIPERLVKYRIHKNQITNIKEIQRIRYANQIKISYLTNICSKSSSKKFINLNLINNKTIKYKIAHLNWLYNQCAYLKNKNEEKLFFDNFFFQKFLDDYKVKIIRHIFLNSIEFNPPFLFFFIINIIRFSKYFTFLEMIKFTIKCFINYKKT
jgi:glycosyltransferase involved in cell wall biosynthesis